MRRTSCFCVALLAFLPFLGGNVEAQDLLNDTIPLSNARLDLKTYAANLDGGSQLISITSRPGSDDVFVTNQFGQVFAVADNGNGAGVPTLWFDYDDSINIARNNAGNGYELDSPNQTHGGLRSIAFHPEFETNGKFYTSAMVDRPTNAQVANGIGSDFNYLGNSNSGFDAESVLAEWTVGADGSVNPNSYRELFRVRMPVFDHPIKQIIFNDFAEPGDEDYGLLYIAHGDGSTQSTSAGDGLNPLDGLGKILRINPLEEELPEPVENDDPPAANQTQLVAGFDQRYIGSTYNLATGALIDASGNGQTASAVGGNFSFTTTPNGATALQNNDAGGDTGERLQFTRNNVLGGSNGFTIQAVFAGNETPGGDGATGVIGLSETAGFSGLFLGGQPGSIEVRGGNVDNQGNSQGSFLNDGNVNNSAANGQFAIYTVVVDPDASSGNVMTATITDPLTGNVLASTAVGNPGTAIQGIGNIGALFAGEVGFPGGAFNSQDNFQGAIADVVVYNLALSPAAIAQNNEFFNEAYFGGEPIPSQPEPYTTPGNPFVDDSGTLNEIYSLGHRNPHHISFAEAADGSTHLIAAETGRDNVEEVNLVQAGANYGWGLREGTFVHENGGGYINGVSALPNNDAQNGFTYPSVLSLTTTAILTCRENTSSAISVSISATSTTQV